MCPSEVPPAKRKIPRPQRGRRPPRQRRTDATGPGSGQPQQPTDQSTAAAAQAGTGATPAGGSRGRSGDHQGYPSGKPQQRRQQGRQHHHHRAHSGPKPKPKPLIPITKAMIDGKEPLRTFGDLLQFVKHQTPSEQAPTAVADPGPKVVSGPAPGQGESQPLQEKRSDTADNGANSRSCRSMVPIPPSRIPQRNKTGALLRF